MIPEGTFHLDLSTIEPLVLAGIGAKPLGPEDPESVGSFPLVAVLGQGGMGRVYLAATPRGYGAIKLIVPGLSNDPEFLQRFEQELDNQARMPTGVSARVLATDKTARSPWFVTEYIPGLTLHDAVYTEGGSLPPEAVWRLLHELASRLETVHASNVTHRDLKPSNVILTADGCRIIDFGIARAADQSPITGTGVVVGTLHYMSPEQASGQLAVGAAADVYALAGTVLFAATGLPPFGAASGPALQYNVVNTNPDLSALRELDPAMAEILEPCFGKDPASRPSAAELAERAAARATAVRDWPTRTMAGIYQRKAFADAVGRSAPPSTTLDAGDPRTGTKLPGPRSSDSGGHPVGPPPSAPPPDEPKSAAEPTPPPTPKPRRRKMLIIPLVLALGAGTGTATYLVTRPTPSTSGLPSTQTSTHVIGGTSSSASVSAKASGSTSPKASPSASASSVATTGSADSNSGTHTAQTTTASTTSSQQKAASPAGAAPSPMASFNYNYPNYCMGACDPFPVVVSWKAQSDATSYDIHYQNTTRSIDQVINVKGTSYTINSTNSGDHYCLQMRADNQYGDSSWKPLSDSSANCFDVPY